MYMYDVWMVAFANMHHFEADLMKTHMMLMYDRPCQNAKRGVACCGVGPGFEPSSMSAAKATSYCLKMFSCFEGVSTALHHAPISHGHTPSPHGHMSPRSATTDADTLAKVVQQLVLRRGDASEAEHAHLRGLKIMYSIIGCLDSMLLMEYQYGVIDGLLQLQSQCRIEPVAADGSHRDDNSESAASKERFILDPSSLARNRLLVAMCTVGGAGERLLPPTDQPHPFPLFAQLPCPAVYTHAVTATVAVPLSTLEALEETVKSGDALCALRDAMRAIGQCQPPAAVELQAGIATRRRLTTVFGNIIYALVSGKQDTGANPAIEFPIESADNSEDLDGPWAIGYNVAAGYAARLELFSPDKMHTDAMQGLRTVLRTTRHRLVQERSISRGGAPTASKTPEDDFCGFDWFAATVTMMLGGDVARAAEVLHCLSSRDSTTYVWFARCVSAVL